jgi:1L-myo-inositol 1-phosphate cytidylyltransferase / CDP-L-myo-inositol myo-inositolphosphotransferase
VKNKDDLGKVKKALIGGLIKPTDGWVSRNLNRPISTRISRLLAPTSITPNQFTLFTGLIGLLTGIFMAMGGYFNYLIGATLFQATSVLDGVDGELARLKFQSSPYGQWLDTLVDNLSYVAGLAGIIIGICRTGAPEFVIIAGIVAILFTALTFLSMYLYLLRFNRGGSLLNIKYNFEEGNGWFDKVMRVVAIFGRRDLFALIFFGLGIIGQMPLALVYVCVMTIFAFVFLFPAHLQAAKEKKMEKNYRQNGL